MVLEIVYPEKISPNIIPLAPNFSANIGIIGEIMPIPIIAENIVIDNTVKLFFNTYLSLHIA